MFWWNSKVSDNILSNIESSNRAICVKQRILYVLHNQLGQILEFYDCLWALYQITNHSKYRWHRRRNVQAGSCIMTWYFFTESILFLKVKSQSRADRIQIRVVCDFDYLNNLFQTEEDTEGNCSNGDKAVNMIFTQDSLE